MKAMLFHRAARRYKDSLIRSMPEHLDKLLSEKHLRYIAIQATNVCSLWFVLLPSRFLLGSWDKLREAFEGRGEGVFCHFALQSAVVLLMIILILYVLLLV